MYKAKLIDGKMMLTSSDIKVGDKIKAFLDPNWFDVVVKHITGDEIQINNDEHYISGYYPIRKAIKVIGEISPEVRFVKEGDEFSEDEVAFIHEPGEDMDTEFIPISEKSKHRSKKYLTHITIKCKCCEKFV